MPRYCHHGLTIQDLKGGVTCGGLGNLSYRKQRVNSLIPISDIGGNKLANHCLQHLNEALHHFFPKFSQIIFFGSQSHPHLSNYPMLLAFRFTACPWRPQLGSSDPEKHTPSSSRMNSPVCRDSRLPRCLECGDLS